MAQTLYGARGTNLGTSDLYTIDATTGVPTSIGPIGYAVTGLAFDPTDGTLYGVSSPNSSVDPISLITVDPDTGAGTTVAGFASFTVNDITFDADGNLFGWAGFLASIDKVTAVETNLGGDTDPGNQGGALSFDSSGTLWVFADGDPGLGGDFYTVDPVTGNSTLVDSLTGYAAIGNQGRYGAAAFDASDIAYVCDNRHNASLPHVDLVTLDVGSATATLVASSILDGLDALAWTLPPAGGIGRAVRILVAFTDDTLTESPDFTDLAAL